MAKKTTKTAPALQANTDNTPEEVSMEKVYSTPTENTVNATFTPEFTDEENPEGAQEFEEPEEDLFADEFDQAILDEDTEEESVNEPEADEDRMTPKQTAEMYIDFVDALQQPFVKEAIRKRRFTNEELDKARRLHKEAQNRKNSLILGDTEQELMVKYQYLLDDIAKVPMTKDEKRKILIPLIPCLKKWNGELPPEVILLMAAGQVAMSRIALIKAE